jgi:threonyl-tRNA synthetase
LPVVDEVLDYCYQIKKLAEQRGIRTEVDTSGNRLAKLVRNAEKEKIPISAVIGLKEKNENILSLRTRKFGILETSDALTALDGIQQSILSNVEFDGKTI